jgi:hypothetical protein
MSDVREAPPGASGPDGPEQGRDKTVRREPAPAKKGRCSVHSGEDSVASCDVCGRALCIACAIPVRGSVVGQECLSEVLEDPPPAPDPPGPPPRARAIAVAGFLLVVGSSILPWARYGDASGWFGAWTPNWSLLAVVAALAGAVLMLLRRRTPWDQRVQSLILVALAVVALVSVTMHALHPPPLSERAPLGWGLALLGSCAALLGALRLLQQSVRPTR